MFGITTQLHYADSQYEFNGFRIGFTTNLGNGEIVYIDDVMIMRT